MDGDYRIAQGAVAHNFWATIFSMHDFFLHYPSVLICFFCIFFLQLRFWLPEEGNHQAHAPVVFNHTAHKVMKDVVSYARIQANNMYYREVLGQKKNKKLGSSKFYLTEEQ
jgi:hypothetical protein